MNKIFVKNTSLKEFIDFALSLKEMKEVKEKGFPELNGLSKAIPTAISFSFGLKSWEKAVDNVKAKTAAVNTIFFIK